MKLYETGHCFAEFRPFRDTEKIRKYEKKVFRVVSRNRETMFRFVFSYNFVKILYFLFDFHNFYSSFVPLYQVLYLL